MVEDAGTYLDLSADGDGRIIDYAEYVAEHSVALQRFAYLIAGDREDARDAVQDALLGAYPRWDSLVGDPGAYLRRSIVNSQRTRWRKRTRETPVAEVWGMATADLDPDSVVDLMMLERLTGRLPARQRAALVLRFYEDCSYAEIGRILECAEPSARSMVHRALAELRHGLGGGRDE